MGDIGARGPRDDTEVRSFTRATIRDLEALAAMLDSGAFETGRARFGVEQEMYLVRAAPPHRPAPIAMEILEERRDPCLTAELASFNLEANLEPLPLEGGFLFALERRLGDTLADVDRSARARGARVLLTGILPTLHHRDLVPEHMTPSPRFVALDEALRRLRGPAPFRVFIRGVDVLDESFDTVMVESANCSLQLHLQVDPGRFAGLYNLAQALSGPLLAAATNSPVLLGHRLWHETRVALFEQAVDSRSPAEVRRGNEPRVGFGTGWVRESALELFRETVSRYRVLLVKAPVEDALAVLQAGGVPRLEALALQNGTVWRWNRPCYGSTGGRPHLRIENRVLPAGPTVRDEIANAALYYGLMAELGEERIDVASMLAFDDARANLTFAARHGLAAQDSGEPAHTRPLAAPPGSPFDEEGSTVRTIMSSDLRTVHPQDAVDLAIGLIEWDGVHHLPVEDDQGRLVGVVCSEALELLHGRGDRVDDAVPQAVETVMEAPVTIDADATLEDAIDALLRQARSTGALATQSRRSPCLLVTSQERLVGIVTEADLLRAALPPAEASSQRD